MATKNSILVIFSQRSVSYLGQIYPFLHFIHLKKCRFWPFFWDFFGISKFKRVNRAAFKYRQSISNGVEVLGSNLTIPIQTMDIRCRT
jgi:hypothetical protein